MREMSLDDKVGKDRDHTDLGLPRRRRLGQPEDDLIKREANSLVSEAMRD